MTDAAERVLSMHEHSPVARLVYLALREEGAMTAAELADAVGISLPAASRTAGELAADGWARERTRDQSGRGPSPTEWRPLVACPECGERYLPSGLSNHTAACDDDRFTAYDIQDDVGPEDIGLDTETPEPTGGLR
jgi:hypothetical protein